MARQLSTPPSTPLSPPAHSQQPPALAPSISAEPRSGGGGEAEETRRRAGGEGGGAIFTLDPAGRVASWNAGAARSFGYVAAEILGRSIAETYTAEDRTAGRPARDLETARRTGQLCEEGYRIRRGGAPFFAAVELTALRGSDGSITGFACTVHDLTARRAADEALRARGAHLASVMTVQQEVIGAGLALPALLPRIAERARLLTGAEAAVVELADAAVEQARAHAGDARLDVPLEALITLPESPPDPTACVQYDLAHEPAEILGDSCDRYGVGRLLALPIVHEGARVGTLAVLGHTSAVFDADVVGTFRLLGGLLGGPLANALSYEAKRALVAERTLALAAYRESEARFRAAMDASLDALFILAVVRDGAGRVCDFELLDANRRAEEYCALPRIALLGERVSRLPSVARELGAFDTLARVVESGAAVEREYTAGEQDGRERWRQQQIVPLEDGLTVTVRDVTARREGEDAVRRARDVAESASRAKSDFLARMSHELRTPLNSVIGFANVLLRNRAAVLDAADVTYLQRIAASGTHLLSLINAMLDIAKIESGRMALDLTPVDVVQLAREVLAQFESDATARGLALHFESDAPSAVVLTDAGKLQQILLNLVANAVKFTPEGAVAVAVHTASPVPERGRGRDAGAAFGRIVVRDTGVGIPADRLEAIFEPFEQADTSTARRYGGTGLGLSISRSLCETLGYTLTVESTPGVGTSFVVQPRREPEEPPARGETA